MTLSEDDVIKILRLVEESSFDSLQLEYGDTKLVISKSGGLPLGAADTMHAVPAPSPAATAPTPAMVSRVPAVEAPVARAPEAPAARSAEEDEGLVAVKAPVVGVFYATPEPGAPPFVDVGSQVEADTTVGLVEVMKVFNGVQAGVKGKIAKVLVENNQLVEYGQPLFLVEPAGDGAR